MTLDQETHLASVDSTHLQLIRSTSIHVKNTGWQVSVSIPKKTKHTQKVGVGEGLGEMAHAGSGSKGPLVLGSKASVEAEIEKAQLGSSERASLVFCALGSGCWVDRPKHKGVGDVGLLTWGVSRVGRWKGSQTTYRESGVKNQRL